MSGPRRGAAELCTGVSGAPALPEAPKRRQRTVEDFNQFCTFVLAYAGYIPYPSEHESWSRTNRSPRNSTGSTLDSDSWASSHSSDSHALYSGKKGKVVKHKMGMPRARSDGLLLECSPFPASLLAIGSNELKMEKSRKRKLSAKKLNVEGETNKKSKNVCGRKSMGDVKPQKHASPSQAPVSREPHAPGLFSTEGTSTSRAVETRDGGFKTPASPIEAFKPKCLLQEFIKEEQKMTALCLEEQVLSKIPEVPELGMVEFKDPEKIRVKSKDLQEMVASQDPDIAMVESRYLHEMEESKDPGEIIEQSKVLEIGVVESKDPETAMMESNYPQETDESKDPEKIMVESKHPEKIVVESKDPQEMEESKDSEEIMVESKHLQNMVESQNCEEVMVESKDQETTGVDSKDPHEIAEPENTLEILVESKPPVERMVKAEPVDEICTGEEPKTILQEEIKREWVEDEEMELWRSYSGAKEQRAEHGGRDTSYGRINKDDSWDLITCFCMKPFAGRPMIECSECTTWIHLSCAKIRKSNVPEVFVCQRCRDARQEIRRSNRARRGPHKRFSE